MPMWFWVAIGVGSFLAAAVLVGLAVARILGTIASKISELQETDDWAMLPPSRAGSESTEPSEQREPSVRASMR
jgi:hypothetical protein